MFLGWRDATGQAPQARHVCEGGTHVCREALDRIATATAQVGFDAVRPRHGEGLAQLDAEILVLNNLCLRVNVELELVVLGLPHGCANVC